MPSARPATFPLSDQVDFTSDVNGRRYRIKIGTPFAPPPSGGYPVLYVLDGEAFFGSLAEASRLRSALAGEIAPAVIVGLGYPVDELRTFLRLHYYDLSPTEPDESTRALNEILLGDLEYAGGDAFLDTLEHEVKLRVADVAPIDSSRSLIFGHSLGGLLALYALFTRTDSFDTYLALSPSIYWGDRALLSHVDSFEQRVKRESLSPKVFIGVGGREQTPPVHAASGLTAEDLAKRVAAGRIIDHASQLAGRLADIGGGEGYRVQYQVFEGQSHASVPWAALNAVLDFALPLPT